MDTGQSQLQEKALEWLLKLEGDSSPKCRTEFLEWCEKSRDHVLAFLEVTVLDRQLDRVDPDGRVDIDTLVAECRQLPSENVVALGGTATSMPRRLLLRGRRMNWGLAATLAGILMCVALVRLAYWHTDSYETRVGEQRSIKLDDGSMVYINTRSRVKANFSARARDIELVYGEAYFTVAQDRNRPFRVLAGDTIVEAVGTQFNVYREAQRTTVSVVEGKVRVATDATPVPLSAGEAAQVLPGRRIVKEAQAEVIQSTAWRQRQLDFRRASLFEVAAEFNRYNETQLEIADRQVGERRLNGVFDADAPEQLLKFLEQKRDLSFERKGKAVIIRAQRP